MRFYWGLGVGHVYSHGEDTKTGDLNNEADGKMDEGDSESDIELPTELYGNGDVTLIPTTNHDHDNSESEGEDENPDVAAELGLDDRENDLWANSDEGEDDDSNAIDANSSGDEEDLELEYTYNGGF